MSIDCVNNGKACGSESRNYGDHKPYNSKALFIVKHISKSSPFRF